MKNSKLLSILGLFAVMGLVLLAEEPQGGGAQGPPAPAAGAQAPAPGPPGPPGRGGPGGGGGFGGGGAARGGGRIVQVLGSAPIPETMQSFVQALGLLDKGTCTGQSALVTISGPFVKTLTILHAR